MSLIELNLNSFDPFVLEDQLLSIMHRSPHTEQFVGNRVRQIIVEIVSVPLIGILEQKISQKNMEFKQFIEQQKQLKQLHKREVEQFKQRMKNVLMKNRDLQKYLAQNDLLKVDVEKANKEIDELKIELTKLNINLLGKKDEKKLDQSFMQQLKQKVVTMEQKLEISFEEIGKRETEIQLLKEEVERLKKNLKAVKFNEIQVRKQHESTVKKNGELIKQVQTVRIEIGRRQNQRKGINVKLKQLNKQHTISLKIKSKMGNLRNLVKKLKDDNALMKREVEQKINKISERVKTDYEEFMDELGLKMGKQIEFLMINISSKQTEIRIYKEQMRIKEQIIGQIQKAASKHIQGNSQLKKELKIKRNQAETLKKQLLRNFEEQQIKMHSLQKTYRDILIEQSHALF